LNASEGTANLPYTMAFENFNETERKDRVIQMRVRRLAAKTFTTPSKPPVPSIITVPAMASLSTLEKTTPSICRQEKACKREQALERGL